jgi:cobalamin biosynthesis protein CobD/CbiB
MIDSTTIIALTLFVVVGLMSVQFNSTLAECFASTFNKPLRIIFGNVPWVDREFHRSKKFLSLFLYGVAVFSAIVVIFFIFAFLIQ